MMSTSVSMTTTRITMAQALVRHLAALRIQLDDGSLVPYCGGTWAIFGHGNVAGIGEALWEQRAALPTYRAHNEQAMAHAAIAYAKANFRQRVMAVTTSIGPGATNLLTAAALAHVNRLPVLLLPGDVFASRAPDPVLQQVEDFAAGDISANDAFRPLVRYFDRITRPEQILTALPRAIQLMTDPATCGPVCLALPQDVQTMAFDCPQSFLEPRTLHIRRPAPDARELTAANDALTASRRPLVVAGGGVLYSRAGATLAAWAAAHGVPVAETQAGKGSVPWDHPLNAGAIGVTGSPAANALARDADLVIAIGTRLQDFTTGSHTVFAQARIVSINVQPIDAAKWCGAVARGRCPRRARRAAAGRLARRRCVDRSRAAACGGVERAASPNRRPHFRRTSFRTTPKSSARCATRPPTRQRATSSSAPRARCRPSCTSCGARRTPGGYHMEYGYSCMGYEIAGGLGVKIARPDAEVIVMVGDGSYLMMNSEIATSVMLGKKLIIVVLDNRGYGCIQRLQIACGGERFNNMLDDCVPEGGQDVKIDFAAHARSLGAEAVHVGDIAALKDAMHKARAATRTQVIVIDTTHARTTDEGGWWWEVAVPEASQRREVFDAHRRAVEGKAGQRRY